MNHQIGTEIEAKLLHALMSVVFLSGSLRGSETRVLNALIATTFTLGRECTPLSFIQMARVSGLTRAIASDSAKSLIAKSYLKTINGQWCLQIETMLADAAAIRSQLFGRPIY